MSKKKYKEFEVGKYKAIKYSNSDLTIIRNKNNPADIVVGGEKDFKEIKKLIIKCYGKKEK